MKLFTYLVIILTLLIYSCKNNPVTPTNSSGYTKVFTTGTGDTRFEIYSATSDSLRTGYNDIGFKVFQNSQEIKTGFVKFNPKMHHPPPITEYHSTMASPQFNYDNDKQLFSGYLSFIMKSDSQTNWFGFFNYNDNLKIDSVMFRVLLNPYSQVKAFVDDSTHTIFYITLVSPQKQPIQGLNDLRCLIHQTPDDINFTEIDSAQMFIFPWMTLMGHSSSGNINPAYSGAGIYSGRVNLNMSGDWNLYDTVHYQNRVITPANNPPKFLFQVP